MIIVSRALTGHTHYMSPYECYDSCGTCDGARCNRCHERFEVEDVDTGKRRMCAFKEEAEELKARWEAGEE